ncbi:MAG: hypothetical protein AB7V42_05060 [Thermoleophilia bacterium]
MSPPPFRARALAGVRVTLYEADRAAAMLNAAEGRWPDHERADRVCLGVGLAACATQRCPDQRWPAYRDLLVHLAREVAATAGSPLPGGLAPLHDLGVRRTLDVVAWEGDGPVAVDAELVSSPRGTVPRLVKPKEDHGPVKEIAALALLIALAADAGRSDRLALAFAVEGLVAWYRDADRRSLPRDALAYALGHADRRLVELGLPPIAGG